MTTLYGIPNCDTVKKARTWLAANNIDFEFVDFKKVAPNATQISAWLAEVPLETLLNKRGTTWRKLSADEQAQATTQEGAIALMLAHPSVIKRPVLQQEDKVFCGFKPELYAQIFGK